MHNTHIILSKILPMNARITATFAALAQRQHTALIPFIMAGDDSLQRTAQLLEALPHAGADIIELGMPFSDPTADGIAIQAAGIRALQAHTTLKDTLALVAQFRTKNTTTPIILMGYYNPIYVYGGERFAKDAAQAGVDGVIIVDLPPEEEAELKPFLDAQSIDLIRLIAPTTDDTRLTTLLQHASGFVYTIAIKGITGAASADEDTLQARLKHIRSSTTLPVVAGFGIRTAQQAAALKGHAHGVVIGSALVDTIHQHGVEAGVALIQEISQALSS
jgi:tryptophan synthase alpha chain